MFSKRLQFSRKASGLSQSAVAKIIGVSPRFVSYLEAGEREPSISQLLTLAELFQTSTDYLLGRTDDPTPPIPRVN